MPSVDQRSHADLSDWLLTAKPQHRSQCLDDEWSRLTAQQTFSSFLKYFPQADSHVQGVRGRPVIQGIHQVVQGYTQPSRGYTKSFRGYTKSFMGTPSRAGGTFSCPGINLVGASSRPGGTFSRPRVNSGVQTRTVYFRGLPDLICSRVGAR